jgi:hypothetical protein
MGPDALISVFVFVAGYVAIAFKGHGRPAGRDGLCLGHQPKALQANRRRSGRSVLLHPVGFLNRNRRVRKSLIGLNGSIRFGDVERAVFSFFMRFRHWFRFLDHGSHHGMSIAVFAFLDS